MARTHRTRAHNDARGPQWRYLLLLGALALTASLVATYGGRPLAPEVQPVAPRTTSTQSAPLATTTTSTTAVPSTTTVASSPARAPAQRPVAPRALPATSPPVVTTVPPTVTTVTTLPPRPVDPITFSVIFDGQSLNGRPRGVDSAPSKLMAGRDIPTSEVWIDGYSWMQLAPTVADRIGTFPTVAQVTIAIGIGGTTDYRFFRTGEQVYADMVSWAVNARAAGVDYVIQTTTTPSSKIVGEAEDNRRAGNALVLADASHAFDAVVDLAGDPRLSDVSNTAYYLDGTHWTAAAAQVAADLLAVALDARVG